MHSIETTPLHNIYIYISYFICILAICTSAAHSSTLQEPQILTGFGLEHRYLSYYIVTQLHEFPLLSEKKSLT